MTYEQHVASGFLEGHASRDPEVEKLQSDLDAMTQSNGRTVMEAAELHRLLIAQREASHKLFRTVAFFASVIKSGERWTEHCETAYQEAVKVATPGHSPEGKTL